MKKVSKNKCQQVVNTNDTSVNNLHGGGVL